MSPEELRQHLSERFDQEEDLGGTPAVESSEDWEAWSMISQHLKTQEVVTIPEDLSLRVQATIARAHFRSELVLVLQVAFVTGMVLTFVVAYALGFDWLQRLLALANPESAAKALRNVSDGVWSAISALPLLPKMAATVWKLVPILLMSFAIVTLLAEHALLWFLRLGPFHPKTHARSH